ncbi:MAG: GTP-binding protein [Candidatus Heimdallarchaeota archaeon]|nr:GTP-binding protein [Candidatus Heimdallarchaeota archaeon]
MSSYTKNISDSMNNKNNIRNVSIVSHVDHGKTTLSDHLLQAGGLISRTMAGTARALDYLEEEQKRGITIKTANISLLYNTEDNDFLINLVDTPGHVDFSGMVSQALRLVDGVVIVVDAVEQVMAQTESVIKQAMNECLRPILFINKVDRLINELKLPKNEIETRLNNIIQMVNELIEQYSLKQFKQDWKVRFDNGTVLIGSALNGWAISVFSKNIPPFEEIIHHHLENQIKVLKSEYPIIDSFMKSIIQNIPNPQIGQKNRSKFITQFIDQKAEDSLSNCDDKGPTIICLGKLLHEDNRGLIAVTRIFSGLVKSGSSLRNRRTGNISRIQQVCIYKGQSLMTIDSVGAGNIAVLIGLKDIQIGDTFVDDIPDFPNIMFKQIPYLQESVISQRIEPKKVSDIPKLTKILEILSLIKPNFHYNVDENTGEIKIFGIGELQLEIIQGEIQKANITVEVSNPEVTLVEQIDKEVFLQKKDQLEFLQITIKCKQSTEDMEKTKDCVYSDYRDNYLEVKRVNTTEENLDLIRVGFKNAILRGPLRGYPIRKLHLTVEDIEELEPDSFRYEFIIPLLRNVIHEAMINGNIGIYEPIYKFTINIPTHYLGPVLTVVQRFGSEIEDTEHLASKSIIKGEISVESSLQTASELRAASEGYAFWQFEFMGYKRKI